jgi:hypothetical protein
MRDHRRYAYSVWAASLLRADMISGKDRRQCHVGVIEALTEFTVSGQLHDVIACPPMAAAGCK